MSARKSLILSLLFALLSGGVVRAQDAAPAHDLLLANLWMQRAVEYRANTLTVYALARIRLDEALADRNWTAAPGEQTGDFQNLPPAVVLDVDETVLDNSKYQVWLMRADQSFSTKTWNQFCAARISAAIPGAVEFTRYADSKGVKVFYVTNRGAETEKDTRENMATLGFPMGGNVDTFLMQGEKSDWTGAKSTRRAVIAKDYRGSSSWRRHEPMKPATNLLAGGCRVRAASPTCWIQPSFMTTTMRSPMVMASTWSCVT
jgi:5'-nucleotidase (lipoprotein e(P4) family)